MLEAELITACIRNDKSARKQFFEMFYGKFSFIALRYCKSQEQADDFILKAFQGVFSALPKFNHQSNFKLEPFVKFEFIASLINEIKNIRQEYYVASTVRATDKKENSYDLFIDNLSIDLASINKEILIEALHELAPAQRLVFNLLVIDGYSLSLISDLLDSNEQTINSNLEKARFSLQKKIEKNLKLRQHE
ncbi:MAG: RNA polymerase sigma factor [Bacteroidota bacterium]